MLVHALNCVNRNIELKPRRINCLGDRYLRMMLCTLKWCKAEMTMMTMVNENM